MPETDDEWSFDPTFLTPDGTELERSGRVTSDETPEHRDADVLRRMHHDEGMPVSNMADELGVSASTVRGQMVRLGVERLGHRPESSLSGRRGANDHSGESALDLDAGSDGQHPCPDCGQEYLDPADQHDCMRAHARRRAGPRP